MKEICIPISGFRENEIAEVIVKINGHEEKFEFRVESFPWTKLSGDTNNEEYLNSSLQRIYKLKSTIENYDKTWELIQIFTPVESAEYIQVLYRKRQ